MRTGGDRDTLVIPFIAGECVDTLRIPLAGRREEPSIAASDTAIDFGTLFQCDLYHDTSIVLSNRSGVEVTIDTVAGSNGISLYRPTLPIRIAPNSSQLVFIRFQPRQSGPAAETLTFFIAPCGGQHRHPCARCKEWRSGSHR